MLTVSPSPGELFLLGFDNNNSDILCEFHREYGLGGAIIFGRNVESPEHLKEMICSIRSQTEGDLLIAIDQEGGSVNRLCGAQFPTYPSAAYYGERADIDGLKHAVAMTCERLLEIGINMNLSPVADVLTNRQNSLMRRRCYSSDVAQVNDYVGAVIDVQSRLGVASCAKHFPGLGDSVIDPHQEIAVCDRSREFFEENMFPPFEAAIAHKCPAIMTTHVIAQSLDSDNMATCSPNIVGGILRDSMAYDGVIITDDLDMSGAGDLHSAVIGAIMAGHDMLLICHSFGEQLSCAEALLDLLRKGELAADEIERRISRVRQMKRRFAIKI